MLLEVHHGTLLHPRNTSKKGSHALSQVSQLCHRHMLGATCHIQQHPCTLDTSARLCPFSTGSSHRMYLLDREVEAPIGSEGGPIERFDIFGTTGNGTTLSHCLGSHPSYASLTGSTDMLLLARHTGLTLL